MPEVHLTPSSRDLPAGLSEAQWRDAVGWAAAQWSYPALPCTSLELIVDDVRDLRVSKEDGTNLIVFRNREWCHNELCKRNSAFPKGTFGMTQTYPVGARGKAVREADVELNGVHFEFVVGVAEQHGEIGGRPRVSVDAALLHEIGQVLGLEDVCGGHEPRASEVCSDAARSRVMYAPAQHLELSPADVTELCTRYPRPIPDGRAGSSMVVALALALVAGVSLVSFWLRVVRCRQKT